MLALARDMGLFEGSTLLFGEASVGLGHAKAGKEHDGGAVTVREEDFEPGVVKFVHRDGYGFISRKGLPDVYFHVARLPVEVANQLDENVSVMVAVGDSKRGPSALMVKLA